jgi:hypothetical protein
VKYKLKIRIYLTLPYLFLFLYASTAQTIQPISTHDGSNDAVWSKEVPFGGGNDVKLFLGVEIPKNPNFLTPDAENPAKSIHSNNFWTVIHTRKIPTDHLYKIWVAESNGDVIYCLERPPSGRFRLSAINDKSKNAYNVEMLQATRKTCIEH